MATLFDQYDLFLLDAYGVLTTSQGVIPGAKDFLNYVRQSRKTLRVLSNDCSRTRENARAFYESRGLHFELDEVINAGHALTKYFADHQLIGSRCAVLGTKDTQECVRRAGGLPIDILIGEAFDLIVIGDDSGFETLPTMNTVLTFAHQAARRGQPLPVIVANPDLMYQKSESAFGFTSGSLATLLEMGLRELNPSVEFQFTVVGKPSPFMFEMATAETSIPKTRTLMIGDQLRTDIEGANRVGIASCLVGTGLTLLPLADDLPLAMQPKHVINSLSELDHALRPK
ncbi:MAG TPA: HAD-IIA family hydrolase [Bdellovibrionales bacterium]|nr:HAD-IIA family hydrolase [Bdellovibrionales bacterium]